MGTRIEQTDLARDALYTKVNQIASEKQDLLTAGDGIDITNGVISVENILTAGTGIDITNDVISVEGVKNQRNTSTAIKTWTGTKAQYNAIATKDSNTLYHITDDTSISVSILEMIYPVGSIYIGTMNTCPLATLFGTWTLVGSGKVLQGADGNHSAGSTIAAGLPDHTHHIGIYDANGSSGGGGYIPANSYNAGAVIVNSGVDGESGNGNWTDRSPTGYCTSRNQLDNASASNSIYGNSNTVQPPAFVVNIWERTA